MYVFMKFGARCGQKIGVKTQKSIFKIKKFNFFLGTFLDGWRATKKNTWGSIYSPFHISSKNPESNRAYLGGQIAFWKSYVNAKNCNFGLFH